MEFLTGDEYSYDGIIIPCVAKRVGGRWEFTMLSPTWFVDDVNNELSETGAFVITQKSKYKFVLGQRLPLID